MTVTIAYDLVEVVVSIGSKRRHCSRLTVSTMVTCGVYAMRIPIEIKRGWRGKVLTPRGLMHPVPRQKESNGTE